MEIIAFLFDFILHVDKYLETFVLNYGLWVYALLFLVIFIETGLVVMPFLPARTPWPPLTPCHRQSKRLKTTT